MTNVGAVRRDDASAAPPDASRLTVVRRRSRPQAPRPAGQPTAPAFILTPSVTNALKHWSVVKAPPKNCADRAQVQTAFNAWAKESGRPLCQLSLILAGSLED